MLSEEESIQSNSESEKYDPDVEFVDIVPGSHPNNLEMKDSSDYEYKLLNPEQLNTHMNSIIKEVENVLHLPPTTIRLLLTKFKWDKDRLVEHYFERDSEQVFRDANIISPSQRSIYMPFAGKNNERGVDKGTVSRVTSHGSDNMEFIFHASGPVVPFAAVSNSVMVQEPMCEICYMNAPLNEMTGLGCGHFFCLNCWTEYLTNKIMNDNEGEKIRCPAVQCDILVDDAIVYTILKDASVRNRFHKLICDSFVVCNRLLTWCPGPECTFAVKVLRYEAIRISCACGFEFCFACGQPWHDPVRCHYLRLWLKKMQDDSETSNWLAVNTKECPKCHVTIEKDGGCNHVICKQQNCRYEFCWVCLDQWEPHGSSWYQCNRYDETEAKNARSEQEKSRANLQRYLFYFTRYLNHHQSMKLENRLKYSINKKMEEMQNNGTPWIDTQFLNKALTTLMQCRRTLMYTYVFGYYLQRNNQSIIFENNQNDMEMATEQLSEYLEREITTDSVSGIRQNVQDKCRYCDNRRKVLLDHVHEGYEKDMWEHVLTVE